MDSVSFIINYIICYTWSIYCYLIKSIVNKVILINM